MSIPASRITFGKIGPNSDPGVALPQESATHQSKCRVYTQDPAGFRQECSGPQESTMPAAHTLPQTLAELRSSTLFSAECLNTRSVKDEMRRNLMARLRTGETVFPGIVGYEDRSEERRVGKEWRSRWSP